MGEHSDIERAKIIAEVAHDGQKRDGDLSEPYITHPLAVCEAVRKQGHSNTHQIVALLHDVVENTPWTLEQLLGVGFSQKIVDAVDALTRRMIEQPEKDGSARFKEPYDQYLTRVMGDPIAKIVKLADVKHNLTTLPKKKIGSTMHSKYLLTAWVLESDGGQP